MRIVTPTDLGIDAVDLKSVADTTSGLIFPAEGHFQFILSLTISSAGAGTTGLAAWTLEIFRDEGGTDLIHEVQTVTAIDTKANGTSYSVYTFGGGGADVFNGTLATGGGAVGRVTPFVRATLNVTEASDAAGAATGSAYLLAEGYNR